MNDFIKKAWAYLNGKKTVIGAALVAAPVVIAKGVAIATSLGLNPEKIATWTGAAIAVVGIAHKLYKAVYGSEPEAAK